MMKPPNEATRQEALLPGFDSRRGIPTEHEVYRLLTPTRLPSRRAEQSWKACLKSSPSFGGSSLATAWNSAVNNEIGTKLNTIASASVGLSRGVLHRLVCDCESFPHLSVPEIRVSVTVFHNWRGAGRSNAR